MFRNDYNEDQFVNAFEKIAASLEKIVDKSRVTESVPAPRTKDFDDVKTLANAGQIIPAIKLFRELTGASLKDSKDVVDMLCGIR